MDDRLLELLLALLFAILMVFCYQLPWWCLLALTWTTDQALQWLFTKAGGSK